MYIKKRGKFGIALCNFVELIFFYTAFFCEISIVEYIFDKKKVIHFASFLLYCVFLSSIYRRIYILKRNLKRKLYLIIFVLYYI